VRRREFITLIGGTAAWSVAARAQQAELPRRIGFLLVGFSPDSKAAESFRRGLMEAGYTEGRDVVIEWRVAKGDYILVPELIADLIQRRVEVMVQDSTVGTEVAKRSMSTIPIVMAYVLDPVSSGLVKSLALQRARTTIGYLDVGSFEKRRNIVADVQRGLSEIGYIEGKNLTIEYRWVSEDALHRLPDLARDLVGRQVAVIIALQTPSALAAKGATKSIPIVFETAVNPVEAGLVASLNCPGGNLTGITSLVVEVATKRLELLHELRPSAALFAYLLNPLLAPAFNEAEMRELQAAAQKLGL